MKEDLSVPVFYNLNILIAIKLYQPRKFQDSQVLRVFADKK